MVPIVVMRKFLLPIAPETQTFDPNPMQHPGPFYGPPLILSDRNQQHLPKGDGIQFYALADTVLSESDPIIPKR
jgi:hypothetical protein